MSKRPIIFEVIENLRGGVLFATDNREEALEHAYRLIVNEPGLEDEITFLITRPNGKSFTVLFSVTGSALRDFLDAELND